MRSRERPGAGLAVALAAGLAALACAGGVVPQDTFYRLEGIARPAPLPAPVFDGVLSVQRPAADPLLGSRSIPWREDRPGAGLQQYHYHHWAEAPATALQRELVACLRSARVARRVVTPRERARADFELSSRIERLEHVRDGGGGRVLLGMEVAVRRTADSARVHLGRYRAEQGAAGDMEAVARAFTRAAERLCADLVADLVASSGRAAPGPQAAGSGGEEAGRP